jgi:hypothetical protein
MTLAITGKVQGVLVAFLVIGGEALGASHPRLEVRLLFGGG